MINLLAFLSSFTLFFTEFAASQALLPLFGGSAMVWGVSLVFYNLLLLGGYIFSYSTSRLSLKRACILSLPVYLFFPFAASYEFNYSFTPGHSEHLMIFRLLFTSVGPAFFMLTCTSPLFQSIIERSMKKNAYHIYSWSNAGGFAALAAYPFILRPFISIDLHLSIIKYLAITTGFFGTAWLLTCLFRQKKHSETAENIMNHSSQSREVPVYKWLLSSTAVNALLLGVTNFLTLDMPSIPLFWVLPLGIFLFNFAWIWNQDSSRSTENINPIFHTGLLLILFILLATGFLASPVLTRLLALVLFYRVSKILLQDLYNSRPLHAHGTSSTLFYALIAAGGTFGTFMISFLCPMAFDSMAELPLSLLLVLAALTYRPYYKTDETGPLKKLTNAFDPREKNDHLFSLFFYFSILGLLIKSGIDPLILSSGNTAWLLAAALVLLGLYFYFVPKSTRLACLLVIILFLLKTPAVMKLLEPSLKMQHRNFYGIHRVFEQQNQRILQHGMITHGRQYTNPAKSKIPLSYYNKKTPLGQAFSALKSKEKTALAGLGTGALAMYQKKGETWDILELDPFVIKTAQKWFSYLAQSTGKKRYLPGDARISLALGNSLSYDAIVLDAFSGDMVPSHLLTIQAFKIYKKRLKKQGILILHISNLYFDLSGPAAAAGNSLGFACYLKSTLMTETNDADPCTVMVLLKDPKASHDYAQKLKAMGFIPIMGHTDNLWTDSRINLFQALQIQP